jgi:hypothetical protein
MLAFAKFIMAGRAKAATVALVGNLLPLISPAAVALVSLRSGLTDTMMVALWAVLPLCVLLYVDVDNMNAIMLWASIGSVAVVLVGAHTLKASATWPSALLMILLASGIFALTLKIALAVELADMRRTLLEMFDQVAAQRGQVIDLMPSDVFLSGLIAWVVALTAIGALLLARWWQALLYNPGGFRAEFHALRMDWIIAALLMGGLVVCYLLPSDYFAWGNLLGLPLMVSGIALVHHAVAFGGLNAHWLFLFYAGLVLLVGPISSILVGLGFLDSMLDLRKRLALRNTNQ